MQLVTITTRPDVLAESWAHLSHFMPWADHAVVVAPASVAGSVDQSGDVVVITDEELVGPIGAGLASLDHMSRNFTLRGALAHHPAIEDEFLMADDDHRPLKPVAETFFRDGDRHRCFYFYDLNEWPGTSTPFDEGQHHAAELLGYLGYGHLAFGSHMPQLIRKELIAEAWARAAELTDRRDLCEWSLYANVGRALHPELFCDPQPFTTLCWPQYPGEWPWWVRPSEFVFENHHPELYGPGHLFEGLPTALDPDRVERDNVEKIFRWSALGRRVAQLDVPRDLANPWTKGSPGRRAAFGMLRRARQAYDYVSMEDHARITELSGAVARLHDELRRSRVDDE
jgi:hypothetical protein